MVSLMINGYECTVQEGTTILEAAQGAGVQIPTLGFLKEINEIGFVSAVGKGCGRMRLAGRGAGIFRGTEQR